MSKTFDYTNHRALWNWLAESGALYKESWPEWEENGGKTTACFCRCFACDYSNDSCEECPLDIPVELVTDEHSCLGGLYRAWFDTCTKIESLEALGKDNGEHYEDLKKQLMQTAKQIAELPVKDGVKTI